MLRRVFRALHYRDFRLVWCGACVSSIGTWMQKLAQSWVVLQISGSPFLLGLDAFLGEIPIFLFSLVGGVVADRASRRNLLLASQFTQMACAFVLALLFALDVVRVWHILTLSFMVGLAQAFGGPAYQALLPSLVESRALPNAIAMNSLQFNLARIVGPMLGGLALTHLGAAWCFSLNGISFLAVIASLLALKLPPAAAAQHDSMLESMKEGLAFIRRQSAMLGLIVIAFLTTLVGIPLIVFLPVYARDIFQEGPKTYTLLLSLSGGGSVCGALLVAALAHYRHMGRTSLEMLTAFGVLMTAFALSTSLVWSSVLVFLAGTALIAVFSLISSLAQIVTPDQIRGRVMSVYNVAFRGGMPIGSLLAGTLIPIWSAPLVLACGGVFLVLLGLYFLFVQRRVATL